MKPNAVLLAVTIGVIACVVGSLVWEHRRNASGKRFAADVERWLRQADHPANGRNRGES